MDPASAVVGIVSFGFTVFGKVNEIRKSIKGAPQQVQALQESYVVVRVLLCKLQALNTHAVTYTADELACFELLCKRSQQCLRDVDAAVNKVVAQGPKAKAGDTPKVRLLRWFLNKGDFEEMTKKLKDVREVLGTMVDLMQLNHLQVLTAHVTTGRDPSAPHQHQSLPAISPISHRQIGTLQCDDDCTCRCHARSLASIIPQSLVPYVGQLFVSRQLLYPAFTLWNRCNVRTCRGTFLDPAQVSWILPWILFHGSFQSSPSNRRIHFSINAHRMVPYASPIIQAIYSADVKGVYDLFAKQQASIWDVVADASSILWHACDQWQVYPTDARLEIIRFLVEAGAGTLLFASTGLKAPSAHDRLALGLFQYLLGGQDPSRSLATFIQTNPAAVSVFRSLFNMDAMDALEDLLSRVYGRSEADVLKLLSSLETDEHTVARSSVFSVIQYTLLEYAITFAPSNVERLLAEGEDAAEYPILAYAICAGKGRFTEILIANGAEVNMKDIWGRTALHWICYRCNYVALLELLRCAEDKIDWNTRTPDGQNALDLFELGRSEGWASYLTAAQIDKFRSALVSHMDVSQLDSFDSDRQSLKIPGTFPVTT